MKLFFESLVVVAPQGCAGGESGRHLVGGDGVALYVVDQEADKLSLWVEETESVSGGEGLGALQGDGVAPYGCGFAYAFAE